MMMYFYFDGRIIVIYFNGKHLTENMFKALQSKTGSCAHSNPYNTSFKKLMFSLQRFDCILAPSTLSKNLVQVQSDGFLVDQTFHFGFQFIGQNSHQSFGGKTVFSSFLMISLRNVSLPLKFALAIFAYRSQICMFLHKGLESLGQTQILGRCGHFATSQNEILFINFAHSTNGSSRLFPQVSSKDNQIEILLDVVHDLGFQEGLSSIVHDFVAELGLGNVLSELFNTSSQWRRAVLINDLVAFSLRSRSIRQGGD